MDNITLGVENVDYEKVQDICRRVKVEDFVKELPMGYFLVDKNKELQ